MVTQRPKFEHKLMGKVCEGGIKTFYLIDPFLSDSNEKNPDQKCTVFIWGRFDSDRQHLYFSLLRFV